MRPVHSLRLVTCDEIDYSYKSTDRQCLNDLFAQRGGHDDILIIRDGLLTDTSICNVALWNGTSWITPARPLLCGTMRAYLLDKGLVQAEDIPVEDLPKYTRIRLFNALIGFGEIDGWLRIPLGIILPLKFAVTCNKVAGRPVEWISNMEVDILF